VATVVPTSGGTAQQNAWSRRRRIEARSGQSEIKSATDVKSAKPMQLQLWVRIFARYRTEQRAIAGPRAFNGLCYDEAVPLICPTCQVFAQSASVPATACYLAWGCFRYFGGEPQLRGGEKSGLKPHTLARPARGVQRRARSRLRGRAVPAGRLVRPARCSRSGLIIEWQRRKRTLKRVLAFCTELARHGRLRLSSRAAPTPLRLPATCCGRQS
jgi:hypothetical protein